LKTVNEQAICIISLIFQIAFTVRRMQLSDIDISKHHKIAGSISQVSSCLPLARESEYTTSVLRK